MTGTALPGRPLQPVSRQTVDGNLTFVVTTVHIVYGQSVAERTPDVRAYGGGLEVYPAEADVRILTGDFNLPPTHAAWALLREVAKPLMTEGATTLSSQDSPYANLYDNLWVPKTSRLPLTEVGIFCFPDFLTQATGAAWTRKKARRHVSDHAPVYALWDQAAPSKPTILALSEPRCIDLNTARPEELVRIVHIGLERAQAIVAGRPWDGVQQLRRLGGIGLSRLAAIEAQGAVCP